MNHPLQKHVESLNNKIIRNCNDLLKDKGLNSYGVYNIVCSSLAGSLLSYLFIEAKENEAIEFIDKMKNSLIDRFKRDKH